MRSIQKVASFLLLTSILLTACTQTAQPTVQFETSIASTVAAMQTQKALIASITPFIQPSDTPEPTGTSTSTPVPLGPTATATKMTPTPSEAYCISTYTNVNVPNNTVFKGGEAFTKTWKLTNGGSAAWTTDFKVVFVSGESMNTSPVALDRMVLPGQTIQVSVNLTAPAQAGSHQANFMLLTDRGEKFGLGSNCDGPFWVLIQTKDLFAVSSAVVKASPASYTGTCPTTIKLSAAITANGVGTVTYTFVTSDGKSDTYQLSFDKAATLTSSEISWKVTGSTSLSVHIYVDSPNHQDFSAITIPVTCTP
jgi:hypothetical protein